MNSKEMVQNMHIDNSAAESFRQCPALWYEKYVRKIQPKVLKPGGKEFGTRFHEVLLSYYRDVPLSVPRWPDLETEVQAMFEAYRARYVEEPFEVILAEEVLETPFGPFVTCGCGIDIIPEGVNRLQGCSKYSEPVGIFDAKCASCHGRGSRPKHTYVLKCDLVVRDKKTGNLQIVDTKTERRNSKANIPQAWAARDQATLYLWAVRSILKIPVDSLILNVCTRGSEKGQCATSFRRDTLFRTQAQMEKAVRDLEETADIMEVMLAKHPEGDLPQWRQNCVDRTTGWPCPFYGLHVLGESETMLQQKFEEADDYLGKKKGVNNGKAGG